MSTGNVGVQAHIHGEVFAHYVCPLNGPFVEPCHQQVVFHTRHPQRPRPAQVWLQFLPQQPKAMLLNLIVSNNVLDTENLRSLLDLYKIQRVERHSIPSLRGSSLLSKHWSSLDLRGTWRSMHGDLYADWDAANRSEDLQILAAISSLKI